MNAESGLVFDIKRFALHDGPGTRMTIFLKGCPLHCLWCHNPEGISSNSVLVHYHQRCILCGACIEECPENSLKIENSQMIRSDTCSLCGKCTQICTSGAWELVGSRMSCEDILSTVRQDALFYEESGGGITFSGGEPLQQIDFLENCLRLFDKEGYHVALDTSGCAAFESLERVLPNVDLFLFDIKLIDEQKHVENTGISNRIILSNFIRLVNSTENVIVRVPVIPNINNSLKEIEAIGQFVRENSQVNRIDLLPYHQMAAEKYRRLGLSYKLAGLSSLTHEDIEPLRQLLVKMGFETVTGG